MRDFGCSTVRSTHYGDGIQPDGLADALKLDIMVDSRSEIFQFSIVDSLLRFSEHAVPSRLHFYKDHHPFIQGNDVDITMP